MVVYCNVAGVAKCRGGWWNISVQGVYLYLVRNLGVDSNLSEDSLLIFFTVIPSEITCSRGSCVLWWLRVLSTPERNSDPPEGISIPGGPLRSQGVEKAIVGFSRGRLATFDTAGYRRNPLEVGAQYRGEDSPWLVISLFPRLWSSQKSAFG